MPQVGEISNSPSILTSPFFLSLSPLSSFSSPATPDLVALFVDSWSFGETGVNDSCNVSTLAGQLFSDWQQVFQTVPFGPVGSFGGIIYAEMNIAAPGNLAVGLADSRNNFYGFVHTASAEALGAAVSGQVEDVTVDVATARRKRIAGSGEGGPPSNATLRRLSPTSLLDGGSAIPESLNPPRGPIYGSPSPSAGACLAPPCVDATQTRWEVRVVVGESSVGVWAWAEGYNQFYHVFDNVNLRLESLSLHVFNMNMGSQTNPLLPRLSGLNLRVKQEQVFSVIASRIFTGPEIRPQLATGTLFRTLGAPHYSLAAATPGACPGLAFEPSQGALAPADGYSPLLSWSLSELGVALNASLSYTINIEAFVANLTSVNSSVFISLYDGQQSAGVVMMPYESGVWAAAIAASTGLHADAAANFVLGAPELMAQHRPTAAVLAEAEAFSSRRIALQLRLWRVGSTPAHALLAQDPQAPLAQQQAASRAARGLTVRQSSPLFPRTPALATPPAALGPLAAFDAAGDLQLVVWLRNQAPNPLLAESVSMLSVAVESALVGCDGRDHGGLFGPLPDFDACGVCAGDNSTCVPCVPSSAIRDACGVCDGDNSTCCVDYNDVADTCWDWLLLSQLVADNLAHLTNLRRSLLAQCPLALAGTQGAVSCCSPSAWNETNAALDTRACANNIWGPQCLLPFQQRVDEYSDQLTAFTPSN